MEYQAIIDFWFVETSPAQWWQKSAEFDALINKRFNSVLAQVASGEMAHWRSTAEGALAEIIVLDQFSRNIFRDTAKSFSFDSLALALSQNALTQGFDKVLEPEKRAFLLMPFMHSESAVIHEQAVTLFQGTGNYEFELAHKRIIDRFGRYPHRNKILGRTSTVQEIAFLKEPNSSF